MLIKGMIRWHTFRVMLLTSLVWVIFGVCLLVYYMECLGNGINCKPNSNSFNDNNVNKDLSDSNNDYFNVNHIQSDSNLNKITSHQNHNYYLPHYKSEQLNSWVPIGL